MKSHFNLLNEPYNMMPALLWDLTQRYLMLSTLRDNPSVLFQGSGSQDP